MGGDALVLHAEWGNAMNSTFALSSGSSSVSILLVVKRIVCTAVAAPTATPASVRIDSRCPAPPVDYRAG